MNSIELRERALQDALVQKAFADLVLILDNWMAGYLRVLAERGIDWSAPHEFFEEFFHMMCPYIDHLHRTGNTRPGLMRSIGTKLIECLQQIIDVCQQQEDVMRLTGGWTDNEQEIKEHWEWETQKIASSVGARIGLSQDTDTERQ